MEIWKYSHTTTIGCKKSEEVQYYYSNKGRCKKVKGGIEYISEPKYKGRNGERIYITIAKLFPEICGEWYNGCEVDHIDTDRFNNRADNLRVCTPKENMNNPLTKEHCSMAMKKRIKDGVYKSVQNKLKGRTAWNKGIKGEGNPMYGKHHSEESKQKMREALKHRAPISEETRQKMRNSSKHYNGLLGKHKVWNDETKTKYHYE